MRVLIVRFSSFGDIFQALEAAKHLAVSNRAEFVDWLVREDFAPLLRNQSSIRNTISFPRRQSAADLVVLSWRIAPNYDHVYDAHSNLRSLIVRTTIRARWILDSVLHPIGVRKSIIVRSKERLRRFLFFKFQMRTLPSPYRGAESFVLPLRNWIPDLEFHFGDSSWRVPELPANGINSEFDAWLKLAFGATLIALAPSAAWPNKRWPIDRWRILVAQYLSQSPATRFLLLGGPEDKFLNELETEFGTERVFNAVGRTSLLESAALLSQADAIIANDTGLLHVADRLQIPNVGIIGPTAFGYTVSPVSRIAEVPRGTLWCKPCSKDGRDPCKNQVQLRCLMDVSPEQVLRELGEAFEAVGESRALK